MRIVNRLLAVTVALGLAVGGALVAVEIGLAALGAGPWVLPWDDWYATARSDGWDSPGARSVFVALVLAGVAILVLQTARPRPRSVALGPGQGPAGIARRSLERAVAAEAGAEEGVTGARVTIRRGRMTVRTTTRRTQGDLRPGIEEAARTRLRRLGLDEQVAVSVHVDRRRD